MVNDSDGHTLIELVIAMALAAILMTAIYQTHQIRQKSHVRQQLAVEMQQNIRAVISLIGGPRAKARLAFGHPPIGRLSSFALTHLTGSAHAPPIKCVRADCDSRHEKKIKNIFFPCLRFSRLNSRPMKREIRMAGYDPAANDGRDSDNDNIIDNVEESAGTGIHVAGRSIIQISFDNNANRKIAPSERITYGFAKAYDADSDGIADDGAAPVGRRTGAGSLMPVAEHIQAVGFAYAFDSDDDGILNTEDGTADGKIIWAYDSDINDENDQLTTNLATGSPLVAPVELSDVRAVRIWILARTRTPIRGHFDNHTYKVGDRTIKSADRYPRRLIRTTVQCRNMPL